MRGYVISGAREAVLSLRVLGRAGNRAEVDGTVETGFTGALCLPPERVSSLSLPLVGRGVAVLADECAIETRAHRASPDYL